MHRFAIKAMAIFGQILDGAMSRQIKIQARGTVPRIHYNTIHWLLRQQARVRA